MRDPGDYQLGGPLVSAAITAYAGGGQANGTLLASPINRVVTVASAADSVKLPPSTTAMIGEQILVINEHASNAVAVFPNTGDAINAGAADAVFSVAALKSALFVCTKVGFWRALLSA